ncbi:hypothetical protein SAMN05421752_102111 [Natronorubrum thiooxidans]|uniref:Uncharacterized protein n=1 Tax=Natronorubrum thiooxidans TaxID=308853 RepID=A0A1N7DAN2_9EURY|nr:hypothetical protein SAMN05421752_102111 [Natronorubrum thiooxidans]
MMTHPIGSRALDSSRIITEERYPIDMQQRLVATPDLEADQCRMDSQLIMMVSSPSLEVRARSGSEL